MLRCGLLCFLNACRALHQCKKCPHPCDVCTACCKCIDLAQTTGLVCNGVCAAGVEALRAMGGAGQGTRDNPVSLMDYTPDPADSGGIFDNKERAAARARRPRRNAPARSA